MPLLPSAVDIRDDGSDEWFVTACEIYIAQLQREHPIPAGIRARFAIAFAGERYATVPPTVVVEYDFTDDAVAFAEMLKQKPYSHLGWDEESMAALAVLCNEIAAYEATRRHEGEPDR